MPDWATIIFSLLGGGTAGALVRSFFDWIQRREEIGADRDKRRDGLGSEREARMWGVIDRLTTEVRELRAAVDRCENDRDELREQNGRQQGEINELRRAIKP